VELVPLTTRRQLTEETEAQERDLAAVLENPETYHSGGRATQVNRELLHVSDRLPEVTDSGRRLCGNWSCLKRH